MTSSISSQVTMSLEDAVQEVLVLLTGQTLVYDSQFDRFRAVTQHLNRALRGNALEQEWSYYSDILDLGAVMENDQRFQIAADYRFRVMGDDAARLVNDSGIVVGWAHFLPRDALHKYGNRDGLWCSYTRDWLTFSRPLGTEAVGLHVQLPVMREPRMFRLPATPEEAVSETVLNQQIDFDVPDVVTARAAWLYAQTDPVMQPRVQTLEDIYKNLMYSAIERDVAFTDSPYINEFIVPVQNDIYGESTVRPWPVSNRR
jgi:hypothetical protein